MGNVAAPEVPIATIHGIVHGGINPIQGGHVILWETQTGPTTTYGSTALQLATATTDAGGGFQFNNTGAGAYTCTLGQYAYITVTGGYTGANAPNPNSVQMAAIGPCSDLATTSEQSDTEIFISELSTAAAAYALSHFINVNANIGAGPGLELVNVGAPANNNVPVPLCTGLGVTLSCTANGLGSAFANAANLVDAVSFDGTLPSGAAYSVSPANSLGSVPQALLNTLGDIQQACVNTVGGRAGDGSACGNLFKYTPSTSNVEPTDTLSAMINLAQNPNENNESLFVLAAPRSFFTPALTSAPPNFSVAISYTGTSISGTSTLFSYPYSLALDYSNNVYILFADQANPTYTALAAFTSNGTSLYTTAPNSKYKAPTSIATDTLGNVWASNAGAKATQGLLRYNAGTGALSSFYAESPAPFAIAVDKANNVWYTSQVLGQQDIFESVQLTNYSSATFPSPVMQTVGEPYGISIDANQNVWFVDNTTSAATGVGGVFPNTGSVALPAYASAAVIAELPNSEYGGFGIANDASGNAWVSSHAKISRFTPTLTNGVITEVASTASISGSTTSPHFTELDGAGTIWASALTTAGSIAYAAPTASTAVKLLPCYLPNGAQTCAKGSADSRTLQIDSSGSVWLVSSGTATVLQVLGTAAPTWPQLSLGQPGAEPQ